MKTAKLTASDCERLARALVETYLGIDDSAFFPEYKSEVKSMKAEVVKAAKHAKMYQVSTPVDTQVVSV